MNSCTGLYNAGLIVAFLLALLQAPLIYYYTWGILAVIVVLPYLIVGLGLTICLYTEASRGKDFHDVKRRKRLVYGIAAVGIVGLIWGEDLVELADWKWRQDTRDRIVELVKEGSLQSNNAHNGPTCKLPKWGTPPISNGGNEIAILRSNPNGLTVEFYINRGFLDHYSAFVYTTDSNTIHEIEERIVYMDNSRGNRKLKQHWYRVSY